MKTISFSLAILLGVVSAGKRESNVLEELASDAQSFLKGKGHAVDYTQIDRYHIDALQMRDFSDNSNSETCRNYKDISQFDHRQCNGSFAIFGFGFDWSYDNAEGTDSTYGYEFGNGWEKDSQGTQWWWNYDDMWTLQGSTHWYSDNWWNNHHHNWTYDNTYSDETRQHDVIYKHTYPDNSYEIYQTHSLPKLYELVHRWQYTSGEWFQYQTTRNGTSHETERFYEWHLADGSYIYEDYWKYPGGWTYDYQSLDHATAHWVQIHEYSDGRGGYYESYSSNTESYTQHCNSHNICTKGVTFEEPNLLV